MTPSPKSASPALAAAAVLPAAFDLGIAFPPAGQRFVAPALAGSADALALARLATPGRTMLVVSASAAESQRLLDEIPWWAEQLGKTLAVHDFPDWETLPYDSFSPHQDLVSRRLATLSALTDNKVDVLLVGATTALQRLAPPEFMAAYSFEFSAGQKLDEAKLRGQLVLAGYQNVSQVMSPGEYAVRGGIIDLFPMGSVVPYRIDLFDNEIETLRTFDVDTQRSLYPVKHIRLLPGREFPLDENARTTFRKRYRERFEGDPSRSTLYKDMGNGVAGAGIEYYLPLFFDGTSTLLHYLPADAGIVLCGDIDGTIRKFWTDTGSRFRFLRADPERPILSPDEIYLTAEDFFTLAKPHARLALHTDSERSALARPLPPLTIDRRATDPLGALRAFAATTPGRIYIATESAGRRETIAELFRDHGLKAVNADSWEDFTTGSAAITLGVAPLSQGFSAGEGDAAVHLVSEGELYAGGTASRRGRRRRQEQVTAVDSIIKDLSELKIGDPVVHVQHGIGRYRGLETMDLGDGPMELLHLEYAGEAKLFVPVAQLHVISRYSGADPESAPLHQLGSGQWEKARRKAAGQIRDTAAELLNLYARRAVRVGHKFEFSAADYELFCEGFGFDETPDQAAAIAAVQQDMTSGAPMDRLVCGDVGFGKTEVAMRATFMAVAGGKQVAILAPTTLLAEQHFQNFSDRFANFPIKLAELSRFKTGKEASAAIKGINDGTVDIVIGTHKLLSEDVKFARLGLVIIDEEHRFGVRQKEALKALRAEVDVLTLTATPIPRTLGMAMEGLRDFSVIATAPQKRLAIKTFVRRESDSVIREAVLREIKRGGQVYFLHNEVETIENRRIRLEELLPEARIGVGHGQMHERELERVMRDFTHQRFNVLLCTTIIETGIDVPNANTIIMHRADKFGLAQLHQLRGRVGRSHHQAYAYLLVHDPQGLSKQAQLRLDAIQKMEELGSGFFLAMHDLEIRGAGEVLGDKQSGEMQEIGFQLYIDMLNEAVRSLKKGKEPDLERPLGAVTEINLHTPALLPSDYCGDVHERLTIYKRLSNCENADGIDGLREELVDRFGKLPDQAQALIDVHKLRIAAKPYGIQKIDASDEAIVIQFEKDAPVDPARIVALMQRNKHVRLAGQDRLRIGQSAAKVDERTKLIRSLLAELR
ncbi:transcription-repair coupling factor [Derxia lacustris]|uniref:transcription-repair coupling factor n=1 Tax=Derxia lacustris TaxID=764842 RepID=UPI000A171333|nr:transcription-repair coupling factor [Derxia lacustris]